MRPSVSFALLIALLCLAALAPAAKAECPNEAIRAEQGAEVQALPDCMALEMASPPKKFNQYARYPHVSENGERVRYESIAALAETPNLLKADGDPYVATRGPNGWTSAPTTPPVAGMIIGWSPSAAANGFSPDFSHWFQIAATKEQALRGKSQAFRAGLGGLFEPISPLLVPLAGSVSNEDLPQLVENARFQGASADLTQLYFQIGKPALGSAAYLPGDPIPSGSGAMQNTYVAKLDASGQPSLELLARDAAGKAWGGNCGARLGTDISEKGGESIRSQGALSADGTRALISTRPSQPATGNCEASANKLRILERVEASNGTFIAPLFSSECNRAAPACSSADGDDLFQGASLDQSKAFFMANRQLANSDLDGDGEECSNEGAVAGCDLYLYEPSRPAGQRLTQASAGEDVAGQHQAGREARAFNGTVAISGDGSHAYFAAQSVLTERPNPEGATPAPAATGSGTLSAATGSGTFTQGSKVVTGVSTSSGAFAVGQRVSGNPVLTGTTITALGPGTLELSTPASASGSSSFAAGSTTVTGLSTSQGTFLAGQEISGSGIPAGTTIVAVGSGTLTLSAPATAAGQQSLFAGRPNLYLYERDAAYPDGRIEFVGTLALGDGGGGLGSSGYGLWGTFGTWRNQAYPLPALSATELHGEGGEEGGDGHLLIFESKASLTANDADNGRDVFRYDAAANPPSLECVSCAPGSSAAQPDAQPFDVTSRRVEDAAGPDFAEQGRWASEDGEAIVFRSPQALLPGHVEGQTDPYLWREGQLYRLPGTPYMTNSPEDGPTLSPDGTEAAFQSYSQLLPEDGDTSPDVYVARAGGGFAQPPPPNPCQGEACQGQAASSPAPPSVASATLSGSGNPAPKPAACRKGTARHQGRCAKRKQAHKRQHRRHSASATKRSQG